MSLLRSSQMGSSQSEGLLESEIHGFHTMEDLDVGTIIEEAKTRWLRPNEIHAMLCNHRYFNINVKPVNLPKSGAIVFFDRKKLRNFRKDGHNWTKKKDGKTIKEAHEHLKVGNEERIHVYYAHGEDCPTFVRRCYWLLDKVLEHIVLVHYRETQETQMQGFPVTPVNSDSSAAISDPSASWTVSEDTDSGADPACYTAEKAQLERGDSMTLKTHEMTLHQINTLDWEELLVPDDSNNLNVPNGAHYLNSSGKSSCFEQQNQYGANQFTSNDSISSAQLVTQVNSIHFNASDNLCFQRMEDQLNTNLQRKDSQLVTVGAGDPLDIQGGDGLQTQDSFGRWMNAIMDDSPGSVDDPISESLIPTVPKMNTSPITNHLRSSVPGQIFSISDVSPTWAFSTEETKILITGIFHEGHPLLAESNIYCVCGDACSPAEIVQSGVFRCLVSPQTPGVVNIYLSFDGRNPISQVLNFECRAPLVGNRTISVDDEHKWEEFKFQMRLAHSLFSTSQSLNILSSKASPIALKEAKIFAGKASHLADGWADTIASIKNNKMAFQDAKDSLFELALKNRLYEWLLERVVEGRKISKYDDQGQGVIHLCAILDYRWAVRPFAFSGLSLDYRDKFGWTALHWAAYCGREKMVAALLSAGAKPNLVTDPNPENPGGCIAADLASKKGHDGLAAYLAEKSLVEHFKDMTIAGNVSGSLQTSTPDSVNIENLSEEELYLKDTLAAYRTAADAAARIQAAFREQSFKLQKKAVQVSNEEEARSIIAAMRIQHAFRNYETRKKMGAAARIQCRFRTWKTRKEFLNIRRQAIKIQAIFRGHQARRQYQKIVWSVGVLEKAILRWRLKRKGFRGLQVSPDEPMEDQKQESSAVEDFFQASRKLAEERMERAVLRVQTMFRSKKAQMEYQRMKLAHNEVKLEYEGLDLGDTDMTPKIGRAS